MRTRTVSTVLQLLHVVGLTLVVAEWRPTRRCVYQTFNNYVGFLGFLQWLALCDVQYCMYSAAVPYLAPHETLYETPSTSNIITPTNTAILPLYLRQRRKYIPMMKRRKAEQPHLPLPVSFPSR